MPESAYRIEDQERMTRAKNYFAWQARLILPEIGHRVIELGCGLGNFTSQLLERELVLALDTDLECVAKLEQRYPGHSNLHLYVGDLQRLEDELARFRPDSCVCLNVLEHIENDRGTLKSIHDTLVPGGVLALIVPAFPKLHGPIDDRLGHLRRYTKESLTALAGDTRFEVSKMRYMNLVGFFGWWWNNRVTKREAQSAAQIALFDSIVAPVMSRLEAIIPPPFGQSIFAVLQKR